VWAADFAWPPAAIEGRYPRLLSVRDLASGVQLAWRPAAGETAAAACSVLADLFREHGAPLVLKVDNGAAFDSAELRKVLSQHGVEGLYSPPYTPQYNGAAEAGVGARKGADGGAGAGPRRPGRLDVGRYRGGAAAAIGRGLQEVTEQVFEQWHLFRGGGATRATLQRRLDGPARRLERLLRRGRRCADPKAAALCDNLLGLLPGLWRFVVTDGVEPTNNHAERLLRRGVLWRKCSFGSASEGGCRFVERLLTAVQTCRLQGRSALGYLHEAVAAHRSGLPSPSLLPIA